VNIKNILLSTIMLPTIFTHSVIIGETSDNKKNNPPMTSLKGAAIVLGTTTTGAIGGAAIGFVQGLYEGLGAKSNASDANIVVAAIFKGLMHGVGGGIVGAIAGGAAGTGYVFLQSQDENSNLKNDLDQKK
jgi:hypothetical protein